jgi:hypothetical protein
MRSKSKILEKKSLHMGYFLGISLLVRVKTPILRDTPKKYSIREDFFSKIKVLYSKTKTKRRCEKWLI